MDHAIGGDRFDGSRAINATRIIGLRAFERPAGPLARGGIPQPECHALSLPSPAAAAKSIMR
jgi:hypothetical protein